MGCEPQKKKLKSFACDKGICRKQTPTNPCGPLRARADWFAVELARLGYSWRLQPSKGGQFGARNRRRRGPHLDNLSSDGKRTTRVCGAVDRGGAATDLLVTVGEGAAAS